MKKKISSWISIVIAIVLLVGLFPGTMGVVHAVDDVLIGVSHSDISSSNISGTDVTLTVPFGYSGATCDLTGLVVTLASSYELVDTHLGENTASVGGAAVPLTIDYTEVGGDGTVFSETYAVSVVRAAKVNSNFSGTITKSASSTGTLTLSASDFTGKYVENDGSALSYIKITGSNPSFGSLKLNGSAYAFDTKINLSDLQNNKLTFVSTKNGNTSYTVKAYAADDTEAEGSVTLSITVSVSADIAYDTDKGEAVDFDVADFNNVCKAITGGTLSYVKFKLPSTSYGTLYYNSDTKVSASTKYYRNSSPYIKNVSFMPKSSYTGTVSIDYTAWDTDGETFDGKIKITVDDSSSSGTIKYTVNQGDVLTFKVSDFNTACDDATGGTLSYVNFDLPSSSYGTLYYNYTSASSYDSKVSASTDYERSSSPYIKNVSFVPKSGYTGTFTITYTGYDTKDKSFDGKIKITVESGSDYIEYTVYKDNKVTFDANDFNDACKNALDETLSYVNFDLPSSSYGTLYYNYTSASSYDSKVSESTDYYRNSSPYIKNVSFVPKSDYTGTFYISYTGYDKDDNSFDGKIKITVKDDNGSNSKYFTDVGNNVSWAITAIDYLYENDIVVGTSSTTFNPGAAIKRGDFCLMLYRAFDLDSTDSVSNFSDVPYGSYYYDAIAAMKELNICLGYQNQFRPEDYITREEAFALIYRTLLEVDEAPDAGTKSDLYAFSDLNDVSEYAITPTAALVKADIVKGDDGKIYPKRNVTRAEMAVLLYRIITR